MTDKSHPSRSNRNSRHRPDNNTRHLIHKEEGETQAHDCLNFILLTNSNYDFKQFYLILCFAFNFVPIKKITDKNRQDDILSTSQADTSLLQNAQLSPTRTVNALDIHMFNKK